MKIFSPLNLKRDNVPTNFEPYMIKLKNFRKENHPVMKMNRKSLFYEMLISKRYMQFSEKKYFILNSSIKGQQKYPAPFGIMKSWQRKL